MSNPLIGLRNLGLGLAAGGALLPALLASSARAEVSGAAMSQYTSFPVIATESAVPLVMLAMSKDHQYWFKAYNDYTDLDIPPDGEPETTYKHAVDYFGYFDSRKCYDYESSRFEPKAFTTDKYCDTVSGAWSGNFLNWATMTRMDVVRKILYGGKRSTDTGSATVLERAHLPTDAHSFAKYYMGDDLPRLTPFSVSTEQDLGGVPAEDVGITICNTTVAPSGEYSYTTTEPPLIRVAQGNFSLWASNERWQCRWYEEKNDTLSSFGSQPGSNGNVPAVSGIDAHNENPSEVSDGLGGKNYVARITVCSPGLIGGGNNEGCRQYPDGNWKPIGLLQQYGEENLIHFGLMTGSYERNISGGVLRKNVGSVDDEVNVATDGAFRALPAGGEAGIINTLDSMRVYGYRYGDGTYRNSDGDNCTFQLASINEGDCTSWGNPISELYLEALRYFAGAGGPTPAFQLPAGGDRFGLPETAWSDPLNADNACARLNTVTFNASVSSYDDDQMSGADLPGSPDFAALTDGIGDAEGITGNRYFIGRNGTDNDEFCSAKTVNGLGSALGLCPEAPTVQGSYLMAGAAHWGWTRDVRTDLDGVQKARTFAVALATNVPKIQIPVPGHDDVTVLPAYRLVGVDGGGALVDFKIVQPHAETAPGSYSGKFYVNWEDSEQGGDYDQDMWGIIEYVLDTNVNPPALRVTTDAMAESTNNGQLFGFIVSGTTQDGFHAYSGIDNGTFNDPDPSMPDCSDEPGDGNCDVDDPARSHTFTVGAASGELLEPPLFFAAKWGGFIDQNGSGTPDLQSEWDRKDADGNPIAGGDGVPDNYFFVTNPAALQKSLVQVFEAIVERSASGTAAAVVANTQTGSGAAYQALYEPIKQDASNNEVKWIGNLHALWVDELGFLREDNPGGTPNARLDDYNTDPVVEIFFDETDQVTKVRRFSSSDDLTFVEQSSSIHELRELSPIWDAREQLSPEPDFVDATTQRVYGTSADDGRHILTWIDGDLDGEVDSGEQIDFERASIGGANFGNFDVASVAQAQELVDYIRGAEMTGSRNRTIDLDGDGDTEVMRLGDIVHSTPTPVGRPAESYDLIFGDTSYREFRQQYAQRRQVIYVGANDGMLHAFNGGFFDAAAQEFKRSMNGESAHPLGAELWAYVPRNLQPHLKWLKDPDYGHVYYVDLKPRVFDAKIFPDDATHPNGWGTVLVVGFRLGGGELTTDTAGDGLGANNADGDASDDVTMRSAYAVLDITDPEQPPEVLAEITHPEMGYTTSFPAVAYFQSANKWYLVFGSGPTELGSATSAQEGRLFAYEMRNGGAGVEIDLSDGFVRSIGVNQSFVGDPLIVDWDLDGDQDALYFGVASGSTDSPGGELRKLEIGGLDSASGWPASQTMLDVNQPFVAQPTATSDERGRHWVFASTGRLFVNPDRSSVPRQALYGVIDGAPNIFPITGGGLVDTTQAEIFADGSVNNVTDPGGGAIDTFTDLIAAVEQAGGWKLDYDADGTHPAERSTVGSALVGGILFNAAFTPSQDLCGSEGESRLLGLFYKTGTPLDSPQVFGGACAGGGGSCAESELVSLGSVELGPGMASAPSVYAGPGLGKQKVIVVEQLSTGAEILQDATTPGAVLSGEVSWRKHSQ